MIVVTTPVSRCSSTAPSDGRQPFASPLWPVLTPLVDDLSARSRAALGDHAAEAAIAAGRQEDIRQVLDRTVEELADAGATPTNGSP